MQYGRGLEGQVPMKGWGPEELVQETGQQHGQSPEGLVQHGRGPEGLLEKGQGLV